MLTYDYQIKLIDLGYGIKLAGNFNDGFNRTRLGTEGYMAPEIVNGQNYQGADIDIFAFGVMMLVMRLMDYPFDVASLQDKKYCSLMREPNAFWQKHAKKGVTAEFKQLISMMLQHEPAGRATMADIIAHQWMRGEVCTEEEFVAHVQDFMEKAMKAREIEQAEFDVDFQIAKAGMRKLRRGKEEIKFDDSFATSHEFKPIIARPTGYCT